MVQRSGIDTIKYHTWPRIPMGKWQTHRRHHKREPRGQPFPSRWPQNRRAQNIANTRQNKNIKDPQKKYRLGTVSKIFYWRAFVFKVDFSRFLLMRQYFNTSSWNIHILYFQPRMTVTSCFVYKDVRDLESLDHLCIN